MNRQPYGWVRQFLGGHPGRAGLETALPHLVCGLLKPTRLPCGDSGCYALSQHQRGGHASSGHLPPPWPRGFRGPSPPLPLGWPEGPLCLGAHHVAGVGHEEVLGDVGRQEVEEDPLVVQLHPLHVVPLLLRLGSGPPLATGPPIRASLLVRLPATRQDSLLDQTLDALPKWALTSGLPRSSLHRPV